MAQRGILVVAARVAVFLLMVQTVLPAVAVAVVVQGVVKFVGRPLSFLDMLVAGEAALGY